MKQKDSPVKTDERIENIFGEGLRDLIFFLAFIR